jgi:uncharacterized protein involved in propanediol utilization
MMQPHSRTGISPPASIGLATSHAGEILQGALRRGASTQRLLLSLPAPALWSRAEVVPTPGRPFAIEPSSAAKAYAGACRLLQALRGKRPDVCVRLTTNIPVGKGCGSSTTDILATMRALLAHTGRHLEEEAPARLIEEASDGSVLSRPALFRHREGIVEEYLPDEFPPMRVMVVDALPAQSIDTVDLTRPRYSNTQLSHFADLVAELRCAFRARNPFRLGAVATASARVSQQYLPKPHFDTFVDLVRRVGGYGVSVSHSGTVMSALLPILGPCSRERIRAGEARALGMRALTQYVLDGPAPAMP